MLNRWCTCLLILLSSASFADAKSNPASTAHKNVPARAVVFTASERDKLEYELQSAVTWIRENNRNRAERALRDVAKHARTPGLVRLEAEAHRALAMHDPDYKAALKQLQAAQSTLEERHELSRSDRDEEKARILRVLATRSADARATDFASSAVQQLDSMMQNSRSQAIQLCFHTAAGAVPVAQEKYAEAIPHLEEDANPLSLRRLWKAYGSTGEGTQAEGVAAKLAARNQPTVEQALVVPQFRASLVSQPGQP